MDAGFIVIGNVWERFRECWHGRFNLYILSIFCRYANSKSNPRLDSYIEYERRIMYATEN